MTEKQKTPSQQADRFIVRLPDGMRDKIKQQSASNHRSMNAEMVFLIERGMEVVHAQAT